MNPFISFILRSFIAGPAAVVIWLVSYFGFNNSFVFSSGIALGGSLALFWLTGLFLRSKFLKKHGMTRKEYRYITKNLDEAKGKISRLQKSVYSIKHLPTIKQRFDLVRLVKKIHSIVKKEPKRFYKAERFYFSHLDSVLELTEKYAFLSSQPKKNREITEALTDTRWTLEDLTRTVEQDLYEILSDDIETLNFEIDVAKNSINGSRLEMKSKWNPDHANAEDKPNRSSQEQTGTSQRADNTQNEASQGTDNTQNERRATWSTGNRNAKPVGNAHTEAGASQTQAGISRTSRLQAETRMSRYTSGPNVEAGAARRTGGFQSEAETVDSKSGNPPIDVSRQSKDEGIVPRFFINTDKTTRSKVEVPVRPADAGKSEESRRL
ncbi:5-bromo-4-chloroindolyl phosphate hydrolysis family protein [Mesobacillus zeae]|uniref:Protein xpaC n=1 Tax=Mesobacillus zeae TaxID=1917180 RepID=A0A398AYQ6_9BACI|nr:5-bromo-4-chloroindolyl phosphate hydrolysis family protein [Mesobacillus zeae]RID82705.1 hypothetical protein D1970_18410 [Mesobacillus zeae]